MYQEIHEPFLTYLTIFRSRMGSLNLLLRRCNLSHQPEAALIAKVRADLERTELLDIQDVQYTPVLEHLVAKGLIGERPRNDGRYRGYALHERDRRWHAFDRRGNGIEEIPVYETDIWMADSSVRSTIGAPTPENSDEILNLGRQLQLLAKSTNALTTSGYLVQSLRKLSHTMNLLSDATNPFLIGVEASALFRQVLEKDGAIVREVVRCLVELGEVVTRDQVAGLYPEIVARALDAMSGQVSRSVLAKGIKHRRLIDRTRSKATTSTRGPGVFEHRVSPRLEWLVDFGYLSKEGLKKNAFEYRVMPNAPNLLAALDACFGEKEMSASVVISQWASNPLWSEFRKRISLNLAPSPLIQSYLLLRRRVGPSTIRDVAFVAALLRANAASYKDTRAEIIQYATDTSGISLSGGRYSRDPENIYIPDSLLGVSH